MNRVILMGNLTRDPEVRYTSGENQLAVVHFGVAVNRKVQKQSGAAEVDFINCVAFGKTGEAIGKFFTKGRKILVSGRIQTGSYEDSKGQKRTSFDIIVEDFEFCERRADGESGGSDPPALQNEKFYDIQDGEDEEDLPF